MPFSDFPKSDFEVIGQDGTVRSVAQGIFTGDQIIVFDEMLVIFAGDEMRRKLPNGTDDTFEVTDPNFQSAFHGIPSHFQISIRRKGTFPHHQGGHFNINLSGPNSRLNIGSTDNSINMATNANIFANLIGAINDGVEEESDRKALREAVEEMEREKDGSGYIKAYQKFVSLAADHLSLIGPFLPALGAFMGG